MSQPRKFAREEIEALSTMLRLGIELYEALAESEELTIPASDFESEYEAFESALESLPKNLRIYGKQWNAIKADWQKDAPGG